jgi:hypothetical protein
VKDGFLGLQDWVFGQNGVCILEQFATIERLALRSGRKALAEARRTQRKREVSRLSRGGGHA